MKPIRILFSLSGRPMVETEVLLAGMPHKLLTDRSGALEVALPDGKLDGTAVVDGTQVPFTLVNAPGARVLRVELRDAERPIDDPRVRESMPAERYVPLKLLGRGAAGSVYRCRDATLDRIVAIKLLNDEFASGERELQEFLVEGRNLAKIEHPNLIQIYDLGVHRSRAYMVVQCIDGPDLESLIYAEGRFSPGAAAAAGVQLMRALDALHERGLVHRDVKPSNALVARDGRVRLADFGLVRPTVDFTDPRSKIFGTPAYMAPEQLQGRPLGPATDIYALGASIFHMATGRVPFDGPNPILAHIMEAPPDLRELVPDAPDALAGVVMAMMAKLPQDRPDAATVISTLLGVATAVEFGETDYLPRLHSSDVPVASTTPARPLGPPPTREARAPGAPTASTPEVQATRVFAPQTPLASVSPTVVRPNRRSVGVVIGLGAALAIAGVALVALLLPSEPEVAPSPQDSDWVGAPGVDHGSGPATTTVANEPPEVAQPGPDAAPLDAGATTAVVAPTDLSAAPTVDATPDAGDPVPDDGGTATVTTTPAPRPTPVQRDRTTTPTRPATTPGVEPVVTTDPVPARTGRDTTSGDAGATTVTTEDAAAAPQPVARPAVDPEPDPTPVTTPSVTPDAGTPDAGRRRGGGGYFGDREADTGRPPTSF